MQDQFISPAHGAANADARWPVGWSLMGAFGASGVLWWAIIKAGAALYALAAHPG